MKILMVNKFLYPRGGAETYMLRLGEGLARRGHQVEYFGMYDRKNVVGNHLDLAVSHVEFRGRSLGQLLYPFHILYSWEAKRKLIRLLDSFQPDVIHLNNINFQLTPSVIDGVKAKGLPLVQTVHDYQMICPNHMLYSVAEERLCQRCVDGSFWNCTRYRCIHKSRPKSILGSLEAFLSWGRGSYRKVDRYLCPSQFLEGRLLAASSVFQGKTQVLRNFIQLPEDAAAQEEKEDYVVFAARLDREKGVELLAQAARLLPEITFQVAGRGPLEDSLQGIPNVHCNGFLTGEPLQQLIARARLAVVPSVWYENCPLSILEAISLGTPVVTTALGGMEELVEDGVTGALFRELTGEGLAAVLKTLWNDQPALERMTAACTARRARMMTLERYCDELEGVYRGLLGEREGVST